MLDDPQALVTSSCNCAEKKPGTLRQLVDIESGIILCLVESIPQVLQAPGPLGEGLRGLVQYGLCQHADGLLLHLVFEVSDIPVLLLQRLPVARLAGVEHAGQRLREADQLRHKRTLPPLLPLQLRGALPPGGLQVVARPLERLGMFPLLPLQLRTLLTLCLVTLHADPLQSPRMLLPLPVQLPDHLGSPLHRLHLEFFHFAFTLGSF
mmetsp:Transcript_72986/g.183930  ORF Transcript_72986/g.183930 Transcript_72986/m.183930 type:complete len:208 (+) Transcript_72986:1468-2091(+)